MDSLKDREVSYVSDKVLEATLKAEIKQVAFVYDRMREYFASLMPQANPGTKKHQICSMYFRVQAWMSTFVTLPKNWTI